LPAPATSPYRSILVVTAPYITDCAEFPNDNPDLHRGARWVCRDLRGPVRAVRRARPGAEGFVEPVEALGSPAAEDASPPVLPSTGGALLAALAEPPRAERVYAGPLELDLGRIVLLHRVEDVPPPPDFIFRPFVSSLRRAALSPGLASTRPIEPRPCRVVDEREACQRVARGPRVDVAPCVEVGALASSVESLRRVARRRLAAVRALQLATTFDAERPAPLELELEAVSA
jgi:hypothetical protein